MTDVDIKRHRVREEEGSSGEEEGTGREVEAGRVRKRRVSAEKEGGKRGGRQRD